MKGIKEKYLDTIYCCACAVIFINFCIGSAVLFLTFCILDTAKENKKHNLHQNAILIELVKCQENSAK